MNRIRVGCAITVILAGIYSFSGLMVSLQQFGIGLAVAAAAVIVYGAVDFVEARNMEARHRYRAQVWERREREARNATQVENIYAHRRDGL